MLLAGDLGGTKTRLAIYSSSEHLHAPLFEAKLPSAQYPSLAALVKDFLSNVKFSIDHAVFGVAGPVVNRRAKITNLTWTLDEEQLERDLGIPTVHLINDLAALAWAIPLLEKADLHTINTGNPVEHGTLGVVAPGTGLGEAFLTWDGDNYQVFASEGGHSDFAPTNSFEVGLLTYMLEHLRHVSYEHVCSGIGIPNIYAYIREASIHEEPGWLAEELASVQDKTPVIVNAALRQPNPVPLCEATVRAFVSILGAEAGNMAVKVLSTGGIYIGGGIPPRILSFLREENFMRAFVNKGRFSGLLANIPVFVILNSKSGLMGAAAYGFSKQNVHSVH